MRSRPYRVWVLGLFGAVATFGFIDRIVVQVLVQPIKAELHVSDADMGLLGGLTFAVLYVALSIPIARLAERKNRIVIITVGTALWSIATAASGLAASFAQLLLARIGVGIGEAAGTPATYSIISDYFSPQRRASAQSVVGLAVPLGAFLGGSAGGFIALHWGWRSAFLCAGLPGLALALLQGLTVREPLRGYHDPVLVAGERLPECHDPSLTEPSTPSFVAVLVISKSRQGRPHPDEDEDQGEHLHQHPDRVEEARAGPHPAAQKHRRGDPGDDQDLHVFDQQEGAEAHAAVLGHEALDELGVGLGHVERRPVGLGEAGQHEDQEADDLREDEPDLALGFDDVDQR
ncbi:MAG: MFS transporter [Steroidobacteraceae bacterium]